MNTLPATVRAICTGVLICIPVAACAAPPQPEKAADLRLPELAQCLAEQTKAAYTVGMKYSENSQDDRRIFAATRCLSIPEIRQAVTQVTVNVRQDPDCYQKERKAYLVTYGHRQHERDMDRIYASNVCIPDFREPTGNDGSLQPGG